MRFSYRRIALASLIGVSIAAPAAVHAGGGHAYVDQLHAEATAQADTSAPAHRANETHPKPHPFNKKVIALDAMHKQHALRIGSVRDWKAIDSNHDGYIQPGEMEAYLHRIRAGPHN